MVNQNSLFVGISVPSLAIVAVISGGCGGGDTGTASASAPTGASTDTDTGTGTDTDTDTDTGTDTGDIEPPEYSPWLCQNDPVPPALLPPNWWTNFADIASGTDVGVCLPPGSDAADARAACTAKCIGLSYHSYHCVDADWQGVAHQTGPCTPRSNTLDLDVIDAKLGGAAAKDASGLPCDLSLSCAEYLPIAAREQLWLTPTSSAPLTADTTAETTSPSSSQIFFLGEGAPTMSAVVVTGDAAYTAVDAIACGASACPFYLGQLDVAQDTGNWSISFAIAAGSGPPTTVSKQLSSVSFSLARPTLGFWLPDSGDVIFPPYSLELKVDATVGGLTNTYSENGAYTDLDYVNVDYVFGHVDSNSFTLNHLQPDMLGDVSFNLEFEP